MNIMQYFTKEGLAKYLKDNGITKIVAEPIFENQLNDLAEEVIYFSADEASKAHNDALGKKKAVRGESPISSEDALKTKMEELDYNQLECVARITDRSTKQFKSVDTLQPLHRIVYTLN